MQFAIDSELCQLLTFKFKFLYVFLRCKVICCKMAGNYHIAGLFVLFLKVQQNKYRAIRIHSTAATQVTSVPYGIQFEVNFLKSFQVCIHVSFDLTINILNLD